MRRVAAEVWWLGRVTRHGTGQVGIKVEDVDVWSPLLIGSNGLLILVGPKLLFVGLKFD